MIKIKDNVNLEELKKYGFINQYEKYENYEDGKPIKWWNDGRDKEQYRYYILGYNKYDICLMVDEKTRKLSILAPYDEFTIEDTTTALNVLYDLFEANLVERVGDIE